MWYSKGLAVLCLLVGTGLLRAQQGGLGPPVGAQAPTPPSVQPAPALGPPPTPALGPPIAPATGQAAPTLGPPPTAIGPAPAPNALPPPYSMPPGAYVPMAAPGAVPVMPRDPANPWLWGGVEALLWWTKNQPLPVPLLTTGPASAGAAAGAIGAPGTRSLNQPLNLGATAGVRLFLGGWIDADHTWGVDGSLFFLGRQSTGFAAFDRSGTGAFVINEPVIGAQPFFSTQVSAPGLDTGGASVFASSRLAGGDVNVLYNLLRTGGWSLNLLAGYRYLVLSEAIDINANSLLFVATTYTDNAGHILVTAPPGSIVAANDRFATRNQFNGGQLGVAAQYALNRWYFSGAVKLAIGATHEVITVDGNTTVFPTNGNPVPLVGGNFATLQIGRYGQNHFAVAPDVDLKLGYQLTPFIRATIGYQFLFLSSVARPGNQIDNTYDGIAHPLVPMVNSSYWAQGLNFGLQFTY